MIPMASEASIQPSWIHQLIFTFKYNFAFETKQQCETVLPDRITVLTLLIPACSVSCFCMSVHRSNYLPIIGAASTMNLFSQAFWSHCLQRCFPHCLHLPAAFWHLLTYINTHPEGMVPIWSTKWIKKENPVPWGVETTCHTLYLHIMEKKQFTLFIIARTRD